jgi:tetratricopeptide (TPR) repeat protein
MNASCCIRSAKAHATIWISSILVASAAGSLIWWRMSLNSQGPERKPDATATDPRLAYAGPYQNIHPSVREVGDKACIGCHDDIVKKYAGHSMGCSIQPISKRIVCLSYSKESRNPFQAFGREMSVVRKGKRMWHRERALDAEGKAIYEQLLEVNLVIGSGNNGHSFLTNRNGFLFQTPISWYSQKEIWDTSPGFEPNSFTGRPIGNDCLFCHANRPERREGTINGFAATAVFESIGCERCHGPGEKHVQARLNHEAVGDGPDYTIVNPKHLAPNLREAICQQCHLEGEARVARRDRTFEQFRPGLPLEDFMHVFVQSHQGKDQHAVNHVEQMYLSPCFTKSKGALGCISCHDPHEKVEKKNRVAHYRASCQKCHDDCSIPLADRLAANKDDSCIACHMPRFSAIDIAHTATTNHLIMKKPPAPEEHVEAKAHQITNPIVLFPQQEIDFQDKEMSRDYGIALGRFVRTKRVPIAPNLVKALEQVNRSSLAFPDDPVLWEERAHLLDLFGQTADAVDLYEKVLARNPGNEISLRQTALLYEQLKKPDKAIDAWKNLIELNPWFPQYYRAISFLYIAKNDFVAVRPYCDKWIELAPGSVEARRLLVTCLLKEGRPEEAEAEFQKIERLRPPDIAQIRSSYLKLKSAK